VAISDEVRKTGNAISRLRTVTFRRALRGYHIDDVNSFLQRVTAEVWHLGHGHMAGSGPMNRSSLGADKGGHVPSSAISSLRTIEFRQTLRGYYIDDVDEYLEQLACETDALQGGLRTEAAGWSREVRSVVSKSLIESHRNTVRGPATVVASDPTMVPKTGWAVVTCMDTRVDIEAIFDGLGPGDAHIIRNAGGIVTDDTVRDCALLNITDEAFTKQLTLEAGVQPMWKAETFANLEDDIRQSIALIHASPFIQRKGAIRGFVYDVRTGHLNEVDPPVGAPSPGTVGAGGQTWGGWWCEPKRGPGG